MTASSDSATAAPNHASVGAKEIVMASRSVAFVMAHVAIVLSIIMMGTVFAFGS
jgi:hypothetical protein